MFNSKFWFDSGLYPSKNSVKHSWAKSKGIIRHKYVHLWWSEAYTWALENQQDVSQEDVVHGQIQRGDRGSGPPSKITKI